MKRRDQGDASLQVDLGSVRELRPSPLADPRLFNVVLVEADRPDRSIKSKAAKHNCDANPAQQSQLAEKVRAAVCDLPRQRFVFGRRTPNGGGYVTINEFQSVGAIFGDRLICKAGFVQGA